MRVWEIHAASIALTTARGVVVRLSMYEPANRSRFRTLGNQSGIFGIVRSVESKNKGVWADFEGVPLIKNPNRHLAMRSIPAIDISKRDVLIMRRLDHIVVPKLPSGMPRRSFWW